MADERTQVLDAFHAYSQAFNTLNAAAIAACYYEPCLLVVPPGVFAFKTKWNVEKAFTIFVGDLAERGFVRSVYDSLTARMLSEADAMVSGICTRMDGHGGVLERFGHTCTLRRTKDQWLIAVNTIHAPDQILPL